MKLHIDRARKRLGLKPNVSKSPNFKRLKKLQRYKEITVSLLGKDFRVADPLSFYHSHKEIFINEIYKFESPKNQPVILDCGSNLGTSIVYFKSLYPDAKITGIEADPKIFNLLNWNISQRQYNDVHLINKAVSNSDKQVRFFHEGADSGRVFPLENSNQTTEIPPIHLDSLITGQIDFLKMDIEGSEAEVICSSENLNAVNSLFIEYHSFKDSEQTLGAILNKISACGFRYYIHTQFCSSRPLTKEKLHQGMDLQLNIFCRR